MRSQSYKRIVALKMNKFELLFCYFNLDHNKKENKFELKMK